MPRKNIKPFGPFPHGLIEIKLKQLLGAANIDHIILSTNDQEIVDFAQSLAEEKIAIHWRVDELASSQTSTDELVGHALELVGEGHILWTHVTSPFVTSYLYDDMALKYSKALEAGYDSLMSVTPLHGFLWNDAGPINYDRMVEKWPRTQTMAPVYEINSAAFIAHAAIYQRYNDRIGARPFLYQMSKISALDIDWDEDFQLAEQVFLAGVGNL